MMGLKSSVEKLGFKFVDFIEGVGEFDKDGFIKNG